MQSGSLICSVPLPALQLRIQESILRRAQTSQNHSSSSSLTSTSKCSKASGLFREILAAAPLYRGLRPNLVLTTESPQICCSRPATAQSEELSFQLWLSKLSSDAALAQTKARICSTDKTKVLEQALQHGLLLLACSSSCPKRI